MRILFIPTDDKRSHDINEFIRKEYPRFLREENPELILTSGGDGTLLKTIKNAHHFNAPFLGHASGTLNYLMNKADDFRVFIEKLISRQHDLHFIYTNRIDVYIVTSDNPQEKHLLGSAINDVVLGDSIMGYHEFLITTANKSLSEFNVKGTGIAVCTDIGSTGYSFNLGGPVIPLGADLWVINGIVSNRYLETVIVAQETIFKLESDRSTCAIFIDGAKCPDELVKGASIVLSKGSPIGIAFLNKEDFLKKRIETASRFKK